MGCSFTCITYKTNPYLSNSSYAVPLQEIEHSVLFFEHLWLSLCLVRQSEPSFYGIPHVGQGHTLFVRVQPSSPVNSVILLTQSPEI